MEKGGKKTYVPPSVLEELEKIKQLKGHNKERWQAEAFKEMTDYSKVGRRVEEMKDRLTLADVFKKKKKGGNIFSLLAIYY